ncbi:TipAS antibiotic-recognition domain-containing protein [Kitasatospora sp. NPDC094028]
MSIEEKELSPEEEAYVKGCWDRTITKLITLFDEKAAPDDPRALDTLAEHHGWIAEVWPVDFDLYIEMGRFYVAYPEPYARFEAFRTGLADYVAEIVEAYARERRPQ